MLAVTKRGVTSALANPTSNLAQRLYFVCVCVHLTLQDCNQHVYMRMQVYLNSRVARTA